MHPYLTANEQKEICKNLLEVLERVDNSATAQMCPAH